MCLKVSFVVFIGLNAPLSVLMGPYVSLCVFIGPFSFLYVLLVFIGAYWQQKT